MNEIIIVDHPGDALNDIIELALKINDVKGVQHVSFNFNGIKLFVTKNSTHENVEREYFDKLKIRYK